MSVTNPLILGSSTSFIGYTLLHETVSSSIVDYISNGIVFVFVARQSSASNIIMTASSNTVYNYPSSFSFKITNLNSLPSYSTFDFYLPATIIGSD